MDCCVLSLPVVLFVLCLLAPDKQRIYRVKFRVRFRKRHACGYEISSSGVNTFLKLF